MIPNFLSQTAPADIELLKNQLEFLKQSHSQFIESIKLIFIVLGVAGSIIAYFFGKSFKDFQDFAKENIRNIHDFSEASIQDAVERVRKKAETEVAYMVENEAHEIVRTEVRNAERILRRERVISSTSGSFGMNMAISVVGLVKIRCSPFNGFLP
ncbi:MAG: hypothetical protein F6J97_23255 [Leptolyngbya sp. SIO4C1]|nr:hypothetical protein [Leptolyngbya sp. SIO4C1]